LVGAYDISVGIQPIGCMGLCFLLVEVDGSIPQMRIERF
jgi:hypothetical protein